MSACRLFQFDLGACIAGTLFGWVPDWLWPILAYWPWLAGLLVVGLVWHFSGWPGLIALAGAAGFLLGRKSVKQEPIEHVTGRDAEPPVPRRKRPTVAPARHRETVSDWFKRVTGQ